MNRNCSRSLLCKSTEHVLSGHAADLVRRFASIDLKHYKTKRIALRWRTAEEVVNAVGEETCGSLRCAYHNPLPDRLVAEGAQMPSLQAFELPFTYAEAGETKTALVKVKVCNRCSKKLLFKPDGDSHSRSAGAAESSVSEARREEGMHRDRRGSNPGLDQDGNRSEERRRSRSPSRHKPSTRGADRGGRSSANRIDR